MLTQLSSLSIYGIGNDIVAIDRITRTYQRFGWHFIKKILTPKEQELVPTHVTILPAYLAKRFAAKEAIAKALGTGLGSRFRFHDAEILKNIDGQPYVVLSDNIQKKYPSIRKAYISLSDEKEYAFAVCVIEKISHFS